MKCYRCKKEIASREEFSFDHIEDWREVPNPYESFFDSENITYSHTKCNSRNAAHKSGMRNKTEAIGVTEKVLANGVSRYSIQVYDPIQKKQIYRGAFSSKIIAALRYDFWVVRLQGEEGLTNLKAGVIHSLFKKTILGDSFGSIRTG